jgi:chromosomal replication initiator protein
MTNQQLWQATLGELELTLSKANFTTWFKNTFVSAIENNKIIIGVPSAFIKTWLEKKYHQAILKALNNVGGQEFNEVLYKVEVKKTVDLKKLSTDQESTRDLNQSRESITINGRSLINEFGLNTRYTFENFVVGKGNELAHAAARSIVNNPGQNYNPFFIYGGVGLGKTHLLQAIGHELLKKTKNVIYVTSEKFTNDFIQAVKQGQAKQFNDRYRNTDLLLIDDIQFIAGKEGTQEALFHTFNTLHQNNKQVVISSDRLPKAIPALEKRLLSRFEWGMIADISQPDLETRTAILEAKLKEKNYSLNKAIIDYIAQIIQNNIRELEGALNRIIAHHQFTGSGPSLETVKSLLATINAPTYKSRSISPKQIINLVAAFYDLTFEDLVSKSRRKELVIPRQISMFIMRQELKTSYPTIGYELGKRDHTTAMHAYAKILKELETNERLQQEIEMIKQKFYNSPS